MTSRLRTWGVPLSIVIGSVFIASGFLLAHATYSGVSHVLSPATAEANSNDDLLKSLATKDSDGDGLPDWEEMLYGTDPNKVVSTSYGVPDGEAVKQGLLTPKAPEIAATSGGSAVPQPAPMTDSLTDAFSKTFFEEYMQASGGQQLDAASQTQLVGELVAQFVANAPSLVSSYATSSVRVSASISTDTYVTELEQVLISQDSNLARKDADPLTLTSAFVENGDTSALPKLNALANAYSAVALSLSDMEVPPSFLGAHIALVQSFDLLSKATLAVTHLNDDPLRTLVSISVYRDAPGTMIHALGAIADAITAAEGTPKKGHAGYMLVNYVRAGRGT